jgi:hypothetical protein
MGFDSIAVCDGNSYVRRFQALVEKNVTHVWQPCTMAAGLTFQRATLGRLRERLVRGR